MRSFVRPFGFALLLACLFAAPAEARGVQDTWIYLAPSYDHVTFRQTQANGAVYSFSSPTFQALSLRAGRAYERWEFEVSASMYRLGIDSLIEGNAAATSLSFSKFALTAAHEVFRDWTRAHIHGYVRLSLQGQKAPLVGPGELKPQIVTAFDEGAELGIVLISYLGKRTRVRFGASWMPALGVSTHLLTSSELKSIANFELTLGIQRLLTKHWSVGITEGLTASRLYGTVLQLDGSNPYTEISSNNLSTQLVLGYQF